MKNHGLKRGDFQFTDFPQTQIQKKQILSHKPWEEVIRKKARSFYWASLFLPTGVLEKIQVLYALCRTLDDAADQVRSPEEGLTQVCEIMEDLNLENPKIPLNRAYIKTGLDRVYMEDLSQGVLSDLGLVRIKDEDHLIRYCYQVAGVVGLAVSEVIGVKDVRARAYAVDLGIAMQITNICRDIREDALMNRIYLPKEGRMNCGVKDEDLLSLKGSTDSLGQITGQMLDLADRYYMSACGGYGAIPIKTRLAIIIASRLYRGIGHKMRRKGLRPLDGRVYLNSLEKGVQVFLSFGVWILSLFFQKSIPPHDLHLHQALKFWKETRPFPS